ncbi:MAG: phosphatidylserine decarboxylase [Phycisphaerales bacterium]
MLLTPYGFREWSIITLLCAGLGAAAFWLGGWWALIPVVLAWGALMSFFRDPPRRIRTDLGPGIMLAPADGRISAIEPHEVHPATDGPAVVVRIYLSVLNVHVNRMPCDATIVSLDHAPGKYLDVRDPESATVNEHLVMRIKRTGDGVAVGVKQIAGLVARRIVNPNAPGDAFIRGQRYGMIKFGSTTELIVPDVPGLAVQVNVGDVVRGGLTVLADLPLQGAASPGDAAPANA